MIQIPHLETDVTQACQLSCVACNHAVPLWRKHGPWTATPEGVAKDLNYLATMLHAGAWGALGGEPLLNKRLPEILQAAKASGIAESYEVWTNGLLVNDQKAAFWLAPFDTLVVSVYPGKLTDSQLDWMRYACENHGKRLIIRDERVDPNFMTSLEPSPTNPRVTLDKYRGCAFRCGNNCAASYGYFFMCCCGPHIPMLMQDQSYGTDGVAIEKLTEDELLDYMTRKEPFGACYVCAGRDTAKRIPWSEQRDPVIWMKASAG